MNEWSREFNLDPSLTYLNCAYMSPQLKSVSEEGEKALRKKEQPWKIGTDDFFNGIESLREGCSELINASSDHIAIIPSASYGLANAASFCQVSEGQEILVLEEQFPSHYYIWKRLAEKNNAKLRVVSNTTDWTTDILKAISDATAVVAISCCHWSDGSAIDLVKVGQKCREKSISFILDGSQYVGTQEINIKDIQPTCLVTVGYKWLMGPYSLGFMYCDESVWNCEPIELNWINRANARDFSKLTDYPEGLAKGARRFDVGEKSNFILVPMLNRAIQWVLDVGPKNILRYNQSLLGELREQLPNSVQMSGLQHMSGIRCEGVNTGQLHAELQKEKISVSLRGKSLRVSPYLYNSSADIKKLSRVIAKALS